MHHMFAVVLNNHFYFLRHVVFVQHDPLVQFDFGFFAVHFPVRVIQFLQQLIRHFVVGVVLQHIKNKAFFDGLAHGVNVESFRFIGF
ncbi:hypothetical protein D3C75_720380 [compost metagenome]